MFLFLSLVFAQPELPANNTFFKYKTFKADSPSGHKLTSRISQGCPSSLTPKECLIFQWTNQERHKNNLSLFKIYKNCNSVAKEQTDYMEQLYRSGASLKVALNHNHFNQRLRKYQVAGIKKAENVAGGKYRELRDVFDSWLKSPGHRKNILDPDFKSIGIASTMNETKGYEFWAQCFSSF